MDAAIHRQDAAGAMLILQPMMFEERVGAELLKRAARVMRLVNEDGFAMLFDAAVASPATGPAIDLASSFLAVDDARMALAMARMAHHRGGDDDPMVQALVAEGYARLGDHGAVLETLERFTGNWPEPTLLRRYALSAVLMGDGDRWSAVEEDLSRDRHAGWIIAAAMRHVHYSEAGTSAGWYRDLLFTQYGSLLLNEALVTGPTISAYQLSQVMTAASAALRQLDAVPDRIAYIGKSGEVFAHWMGQILEVMVMPLSARITGQSLLVVLADDAEMERIMDEPCYAEGPVTVFQLLKASTYSGVAAPDMLGFLALDAALPIEPVTAPRAADRMPPRLMVSELVRRASAMLAIAEPVGDELATWLDLRRSDLALCMATEPHLRPPYVADLSEAPPKAEAKAELSEAAEGCEALGSDEVTDVALVAAKQGDGAPIARLSSVDSAQLPQGLSELDAEPSLPVESLPAS